MRGRRIRAAEVRLIEAVENHLGHDAQTCGCEICEALLAFQQLTGLPTARGRCALARFENAARGGLTRRSP